MPFNVKRTAVIIEKEILRSASGLDDILSVVIDSTKVPENPVGSGRYILEAGTVVGKINASTKCAPLSTATPVGTGTSGAWTAADIQGITQNTVEFWLGVGITAGAASDEAVSLLHHMCDFNISKLVGYTGNETITKTALPTCLFR